MYTFKLLDTVIQGFAFLTAIILLLAFSVYGYFYWIKVGLILWIIISMALNFVVYRPLSPLRKIVSILLTSFLVIFGIFYAIQTPVSKLNFYFQPLSFVIIIGYFAISLMELNKIKRNGKINLDF